MLTSSSDEGDSERITFSLDTNLKSSTADADIKDVTWGI